jgi:hypothetical protein
MTPRLQPGRAGASPSRRPLPGSRAASGWVLLFLLGWASAARVPPALAAAGAGALARPAGSKANTGGILNSQNWKVQAGDTITSQITGAKDAKPTSGATVPVLIQSDLSLLGNVTIAGTLTGATVTFTWPYSMGPSCGTAHIAYWGGNAKGFLASNSFLINGSKSTPAGWAIVDTSGNLVATNPLTGRCYPPLSGLQCPLQSGLMDCTSGSSQFESFSFSPGGIVGGQPPYSVTARATNGVTLAPAGGYSGISLASNGLGFSGTFPAGQTTVTITVTDAVGASDSCSFGVTITHPTVTVASAAVCPGYSTTLTAQASGGSGTYSFWWSGPSGFTATGQTINVSVLGQYTVTVTDSNGCRGQGSGSLTANQPPSASITGQTNVSCSGGSNGSATVTVTGGTSPYQVSGGTTTKNGTGPFTFSNLVAKSYNYTVTDANGCTTTAAATITEPSLLVASASAGTIACHGGTTTVTVSASGGTARYTGTGTFTVGAGPYSYTVTDANGCTATASGTISQPDPLVASASVGTIACNGGSTTVTVSASGGTGPYTGTGTFTVSAGPYSYTVTDANGCTATTSGRVFQTDPLTVSTTQTNVSTAGGSDGSATAAAIGGSGLYTYSWSTNPVQTTATATGLAAGSYSATVTDAHGCMASTSVTITEPATALSVSINGQSNVSCNGGANGSAHAVASGGTAPYRYVWNTLPPQNGDIVTSLAPGPYTVTAFDASGNQATATVIITQPAPLRVNITIASPPSSCDLTGGELLATGSGGTAPYSYSWSNGESTFLDIGLTAGGYSVTVTDANGCTATASVQLLFVNTPCF